MRLLHLTDIHYDLGNLERALKFSQPEEIDAVVCSGDLAGHCLSKEDSLRLKALQKKVLPHETFGIKRLNLQLDTMLASKNGERELAEQYLEGVAAHDKAIEAQYLSMFSMLDSFGATVFILPGNWDSNRYTTALKKYPLLVDLHQSHLNLNGTRFSGFGGAYISSTKVPLVRRVEFWEKDFSTFFNGLNPKEVIVTHVPPYSGDGKEDVFTNISAFEYIQKKSPKLWLCGHTHSYRKIKELGKTVLINSGVLREAYRPDHSKHHVTFTIIDLDGKVDRAVMYKIKGEQIEVDKIYSSNPPEVKPTRDFD